MRETRMLRLNTFACSHFSEKVRWVLDVEGVTYEERALLPGPHLLTARRLAEGSSLPILEHDSRVIQGSGAILDYLTPELGLTRFAPKFKAAARCAELEALADRALGRGVQRIVYAELLQDRKTVTDLWTLNGPPWGRAFYALAYSGVAAAVKRLYDTTPEAVARAKLRFRDAMAELDRCLQGQEYLTGSEPCRADITVAALLAPLCRPLEHPVAWPEAPQGLLHFTRDFEQSRTWQHALQMYRKHRWPENAGPRR